MAAWPIGPNGLMYDREWVLLEDDYSGSGISSGTGNGTGRTGRIGGGGGDGGGSSSGRVLTQKLCPSMALVRPNIDLRRGTLTLDAPGCPGCSLVVRFGPLPQPPVMYSGVGGSSAKDATRDETMQMLRKDELGPSELDGGLGGESLLSSNSNSSSGLSEQEPDIPFVITADITTTGVCVSACAVSSPAPGADFAGRPSSESQKCYPRTGEDCLSRGSQWPQLASLRVCGDSVCGWVEQAGDITIVQTSCDSREEERAAASMDLDPGAVGPCQDLDPGVVDPDPIREWFRRAIGIPCRLVRQAAGARQARAVGPSAAAAPSSVRESAAAPSEAGGTAASVGDATAAAAAPLASSPLLLAQGTSAPDSCPPGGGSGRHLGFANDGQYMLLNAASLDDLNARLEASGRRNRGPEQQRQQGRSNGSGGGCSGPLVPLNERHFRPNLVVSGFPAYEEDEWADVQVLYCLRVYMQYSSTP